MKQLLAIGLKDAYVAVLEGLPVATGATRNEVRQTLHRILPAEKQELAYIFRV